MKPPLNLIGSKRKLFLEPEIAKYLKAIEKKQKTYTKEEELKLIKRAQSGDVCARNLLVEANLKFVVACAKDFHNPKTDIRDLISCGNLGLITSIEKYNLNSNSKLISCAVWWIKAELNNYMYNNTLIHVPVNKIKEVEKIRAKVKKSEEKGDSNTESIMSSISSKIKLAYNSLTEPITTSASANSSSDSDSWSFDEIQLPATNKVDTVNVFDGEDNHYIMQKYLKVLSPLEREIFVSKFGLFEKEERAIEVVAQNFDISTFVVKKIIKKSINKIKEVINIDEIN
jgi:RNA polymerase sigma factor (sigma-70 family)